MIRCRKRVDICDSEARSVVSTAYALSGSRLSLRVAKRVFREKVEFRWSWPTVQSPKHACRHSQSLSGHLVAPLSAAPCPTTLETTGCGIADMAHPTTARFQMLNLASFAGGGSGQIADEIRRGRDRRRFHPPGRREHTMRDFEAALRPAQRSVKNLLFQKLGNPRWLPE